jgi:Caudovirus prohead serine protease
MEKRFQVTEVRAVKNGDKRTITGYAARYNLLSGDLGGFRERIASGAFKRILATKPDELEVTDSGFEELDVKKTQTGAPAILTSGIVDALGARAAENAAVRKEGTRRYA